MKYSNKIRNFINKSVSIFASFLMVLTICTVQMKAAEVEIGRSNVGSWGGGTYFEYMTKDLIAENNVNDTVTYRIRYRIKHTGAQYTYQTYPVQLWVDDVYKAQYGSMLNVHISNRDVVCGSTDIVLSKGVNHKIQFRDTGSVSGGSNTTINVTGYINHPLPTYTVTFNNGLGTNLKTQTVTKRRNATPPANPTRNGYSFAGWNGSYTNVTSNRTITATWKANTYAVSYNANGGTGAPPTQNFVFNSGAKISSQKPTRKGYTFLHWLYSGTKFVPGASIPNGWGGFTLTAQWALDNYAISYNLNGGTISGQPTSYNVTTAKSIPNPTKTGYTFSGWTGSNSSTPQKNIVIPVGSTGNKSYIANWIVNSYTVDFNSMGGSIVPSVKVNYNNTIPVPKPPTRTGYMYDGWYTSSSYSTQWNFNTRITSGITLYAKWIANPTITANNRYFLEDEVFTKEDLLKNIVVSCEDTNYKISIEGFDNTIVGKIGDYEVTVKVLFPDRSITFERKFKILITEKPTEEYIRSISNNAINTIGSTSILFDKLELLNAQISNENPIKTFVIKN